MKKTITVAQLAEQLQRLMEYDPKYKDAVVWYRDEDSMDYELEEGLWDTYTDPKTGETSIALA
jgi:hypothetical protein